MMMQNQQRWNRRGFFKGAAAVAAPWVVPSFVLGRGQDVSPNERVVVGYIGTGVQGLNRNLPGLLGCDQAQVVAVCDVWKANRDKGKNKVDGHYGNNDCEAYVDYLELLAREDIDAVGIATPDHSRGEAVGNQLGRGPGLPRRGEALQSGFPIRRRITVRSRLPLGV